MSPSSAAREITWATFGRVGSPMGLQHYESELLDALTSSSGAGFNFRARTFGGLRAPGAVDVRIPQRLLTKAPTAVARLIGARAHRGSRYVHRFDLRLPPPSCPEIVTVHDLPPLRFADEGPLPDWSLTTASRARLVVCPSEFAADEARSLLKVRHTRVIPNGVNDLFREPHPLSNAELTALGVHTPFVLHVGGASERKNLKALAAAWRSLGSTLPDHALVLVGPQDHRRDSSFAESSHVNSVGYFPPPFVARLMASADALVVPSTYEGFGLPALEGMAAGCPVVASAAGALPEVCDDAAVLVPPTIEGIASGIARVCSDRRDRDQLIDRGRERSKLFSWQRSAEQHLAAYADAFG